jgi:hypothetical protein
MNTPYDKTNFPSSTDINAIIYDCKFNEVLNTIFWKLISTGNPPIGVPVVPPVVPQPVPSNRLPAIVDPLFIKINNTELTQYSPILINNVKQFLTTKGYKITEIEDTNSVNVGWKLVW